MFLIKKIRLRSSKVYELYSSLFFIQASISQEGKKNLHLLNFTHLLTLSLWGIIKSLVYTFTLMRSSVRGDLFVLVQARPSRQYVPDDLLKALNSLNSLYAAVPQPASAQSLRVVLPVLRALVTSCTVQLRLSQVTEGIWWNTTSLLAAFYLVEGTMIILGGHLQLTCCCPRASLKIFQHHSSFPSPALALETANWFFQDLCNWRG